MANQQPDYTYGLREKLKLQGVKKFPGMSADESFKTFVNSHYQNLKSDSLPDGMISGGSFITDEDISLPGPKEGFPGPPSGKKVKTVNKIEDVKFDTGQDGIPEISKITYVQPNGTQMVYDVKNQTKFNNNVVPPIKPGQSINEQRAADRAARNYLPPNADFSDKAARVVRQGAGGVADAFEWAFGPTGQNDFAQPIYDDSGGTTVERETRPFSSKWSPEENQSYQETGITPPGRSIEELNATGYQPWVDRSTLINQTAAGDFGQFGKVNVLANPVRRIIDAAQNKPNVPPNNDIEWTAFEPNKIGGSPYSTNEQTGIGYQNMAEHRLMLPLESEPGDSNLESAGKAIGNIAPAAVNLASGLAEFVTSPGGLLTMGVGRVATGRQKMLAGAMEKSQLAREAVAATAAAKKPMGEAVKSLADALSNESKYALQSRITGGLDTALQSHFVHDMGTGTVEGFKGYVSNLTEPVYNKELGGYVGTKPNIPAAATSAAETLGNLLFATQIGKHVVKSAKNVINPRTGAYEYTGDAQQPVSTPYTGDRVTPGQYAPKPVSDFERTPLTTKFTPGGDQFNRTNSEQTPTDYALDRLNENLVAQPRVGPVAQRTLADEIIQRKEAEKYQIVKPEGESRRFEIPPEILEQIREESRDPNNLYAGSAGRGSRGKPRVDLEKNKKNETREGEPVTSEKGAQPRKPGDIPLEGPKDIGDALAGIKSGETPQAPVKLGEVLPSEPLEAPKEQLSPRQPDVNPDVIKEASDKLNRALDVEDREMANIEAGIQDGSYSEKLGNALLARSNRRANEAQNQFERDIGNNPGDRILPQTNQEPIRTQNVRNQPLQQPERQERPGIPTLPSSALEAAADPTKMSLSGETKSQFADRKIPELSGQQAFEKNEGRLSRLTFDQLKNLKETTTADPGHNTKFVSKINEEMASRERKVADTYSPQQSGKNAITDNLKPELMTDAQLKDITDNHPARIAEQKKIISANNRGDYKSKVGQRSAEGEQSIRDLNKLKYQLSFAREEVNKRVRTKAGIARPDGSRIVASQERKMTEKRIDPTTGEMVEPPKPKRDPMSAINHARGRLDKLSLDELIAARDGLKSQGRKYWEKVDEHIKGRNLESQRVHQREYGSKAANMPNPRIMSRTQLEERITELPDEIKQAEERYAQTKSPEDMKIISESKGDLSAFRRELGHRDTMESASLEYEANKNVKQVSGDMPGVPSTPTQKPGVGPFKRDVSKPEVTPIEGRDPEVIRAEGAAAYEAEQQREANTPKQKPEFTQGDSQNLNPGWDGRKLNTFGTIEGSKLKESGHKLKFSEHKWDPKAGAEGEGAFMTSIEIRDLDGDVVGKISFKSEGDKEATYLYDMEISGSPKIKQVLVEEARARSFMLEQRIEPNDLAKMNRIYEDMQGLGSYAADDFGIRQDPKISLSSPTHFLTGEGAQLERDGYKNKFKADKWDKNAGEDGEGDFVTSIEVTKNGEVVGKISFTTETDKDATYLHNFEITGDTPRIKRALVAEMNIRAYWNEMTIDDNGKKAMAKINPESMRPTRIEFLNKIKENAERRLEKFNQGESESLSRKEIEDLHRVAGSTWNQATRPKGEKKEKGTHVVGENSRRSFVRNEAEYSGLSEGVRDIAYKINESQSTALEILHKIHDNGLRDPKITAEQSAIAKLLIDNADKKSLSVMVGIQDTKYDRASRYRGGVSAALIGQEGPNVVRSLYGDIKMSRGHLMSQADAVNFTLHEIVHATTVDKVNRAIFGVSASIHTPNNSFGESGQRYLDRLKAYVNDSSSDKSIAKIARSYLKYLSTLKDESKPISWKKINEATGSDNKKNVIGTGADKDAPVQAGQYASLNIDEFITHAMTDKSFQAELRAIKMGNASVWEVIKKSVAEMLGIAEGDTALAHTMDGVMELSSKDLSEINKPGFSNDSSLTNVRAERFKEEGMSESDALSKAANEVSNRSKYLTEGTMENQSVRSMKDIDADISAESRNSNPNTSKMASLIQERNAIMSDAGQLIRRHPFFKEAAKKIGFNASPDALLAEANYQQRIAKGDYNQRNNAADRRKFYEKSKMSEAALGEELNETKTDVRLERERQRMRDMGVDWDSLPKELKALSDIGAIGSMEWEGTELGDQYRTSQKMSILKGYGLKPEDVKQLRNDVDFKEYFNELENKGQETKSLENKSKESSYDEDLGFEQDVSGMKKMGASLSFTQGDSNSIGRFKAEELQAAANRMDELADGFDKFKPKSLKEVAEFGMDVATVSILRGSSAQLDVIASRENVPAVTKLRQILMGNNAGEMDAPHGVGYHTAVTSSNLTFKNRVNEILRPFERDMKMFSNEKQKAKYEEIGRSIVQQRRHADPEIAKAVDEFRKLFRDLHKYQVDSGIKMSSWGDTYVPRILKIEHVLENRDAFKAAATKAYRQSGLSEVDAMKAADEWFNSILNGDEGLTKSNKGFIFDSSAYNGEPKHTRDRVFGAEAERIMEPFYNRNIMDATYAYIGRAVKSTELARRFGPNFEKYVAIENEIIAQSKRGEMVLRDVNSLVEGQLAPQQLKNPFWRAVADGNTLYQSLRFLTNATLSSASEPILNAMRTGNVKDAITGMGNTMKYGFRNAAKIAPDYHQKLAEDIGVVQSLLSSSAFSSSVDSRYMDVNSSKFSRAATNAFFRGTGLAQWTEGSRVAAVKIGEVFINRLGQDIADGGKAAQMSSRLLNELGVTDHKAMSRFVAKINTMNPDMRLQAIKNQNSKVAAEYRHALVKYSEQVIMNPNSGNKMKYANHPLGFIIGGLQSYQGAFVENVVKRQMRIAGRETIMNKGNLSTAQRMMMLSPLFMTPIYIAANYAQGMFRDEFLTDPSRENDPEITDGVKIARALSRSGLFGRYELPVNTYAGIKYKKDPATALLGPTLSDMSSSSAEIAKLVSSENSPNTNTAERGSARSFYNSIVQPGASLLATAFPGIIGRLASTGIHYAAKHPGTREAFVEETAGPPVDARKDGKRRQESRNLIDDYVLDSPNAPTSK